MRDHSTDLVGLNPKVPKKTSKPKVPEAVGAAEPKWQTALPEAHRSIFKERLLVPRQKERYINITLLDIYYQEPTI